MAVVGRNSVGTMRIMESVDAREAERIARLGREIYEREIREKVEPDHDGRSLVLDIVSGDYEIADGDLAASDRLFRRRPDAVAFGLRIGRAVSYHLGSTLDAPPSTR